MPVQTEFVTLSDVIRYATDIRKRTAIIADEIEALASLIINGPDMLQSAKFHPGPKVANAMQALSEQKPMDVVTAMGEAAEALEREAVTVQNEAGEVISQHGISGEATAIPAA